VSRAALRTALAAVAVLLVAYGGSSLWRMRQMRAEVDRLEGEIGRLRSEQRDLGGAIHRLRSDPEAIEQAARELLGLVKPGERVLKLPPSPAPPSSPAPGPGG
jgi:cell division protein DivIC